MTDQKFSDQAGGNHSFLHFPTTSDQSIDLDTFLDVYVGDKNEIEYYVEEMRRRTLSIVANQGVDHVLLKRLVSGTRCSYWKSEEENCEKPLDPRSPCYNTGWVGGYTAPVVIKIVIPPADRVSIAYEEGVRKEFAPKPWTMFTPMLSERDLLVDKYSGERFEILNVSETLFQGLPMLCEFDMHAASRGTSTYLYAVPVPLL